ncbi:MAG: hypothetical protein JJ896_06585 [Rhodothermales bacterium]|nr:hypothetical protein [Rhodothermales bacterium]MBO6779302.1 hypothetical protein [Rhodothermales bacterium]
MRTVLFVGMLLLAVPAAGQEVAMADLQMADGKVVLRATGAAFTGEMMHYHPDGAVSSRSAYVEGLRHGLDRDWDRNGHLRGERMWANDRRHGTDRVFDHNGKLLLETTWVDGAREGAVVWFYPEGGKRYETAFAHGKRHGIWRQFAADGSLSMETEWDMGTLVRRHNPHAGH